MKKAVVFALAVIFLFTGASCRNGTEPVAASGTCVVSINCSSVLKNPDKLKKGEKARAPEDGVVLAPTVREFKAGDSALDVLKAVCGAEDGNGGIQLECRSNPVLGSFYVGSIAGICEKDYGPQSGWIYKVNGAFADKSCDSYKVKDSDSIEWIYCCEYGEDA